MSDWRAAAREGQPPQILNATIIEIKEAERLRAAPGSS